MAICTSSTIRTACTADLPAVIGVGRRAWAAAFTPLLGPDGVAAGLRRSWAPEVIGAEIRRSEIVVVTAPECDVVAVASAHRHGAETFLRRLYVDPDHQRHGHGHALIDTVIACAAPGGVALTVLASNRRAHEFYARHGFAFDAVVPDPDGRVAQVRLVRPSPIGAPHCSSYTQGPSSARTDGDSRSKGTSPCAR